MAPTAGLLKIRRSGNDDNRNDDNSSSGNGGDFGGGSSGPNSSKEIPPFKVITQKVTVTSISTTVQTSTVVQTPSRSSNTGLSTTITSPTPTSIATSSIPIPAPLSSPANLSPPSNSTAKDDNSPSPSPNTHLGMKMPLPFASIISIILGCLFFITLCLVIYVRSPRFAKHLSKLFRRRRSSASPTISSFEPKELRDNSQYSNFRRSARSFVVLPDFYFVPGQEQAPRAVISPPRTKGLLLDAASYENSSYKAQDSYSQGGVRGSSSTLQVSEVPSSRSISVFDEYTFEHEAASDDLIPTSPGTNRRNTVDRSSEFPQSVDNTTAE